MQLAKLCLRTTALNQELLQWLVQASLEQNSLALKRHFLSKVRNERYKKLAVRVVEGLISKLNGDKDESSKSWFEEFEELASLLNRSKYN